MSTFAHCYPLLSILVHSCPIDVHLCPLLSTTVYSCPLLPNDVHLCPLLSTTAHSRPLITPDHSCPLLSPTVHYCPLLSIAVFQRRLCSTSRLLQRWMMSIISFVLLWSALFVIYLTNTSINWLSLFEFIVPLVILFLLTSTYAEVNFEGSRIVRVNFKPIFKKTFHLLF